ncbi:MAG: ATPase, T2SS/T4P/T4SS family [Polaromonas sp.]|uniref:type IV pilus twitching motility protein PilT n=1 Tax=Polaromonas sp. TaxID=1869339 RepID=UPI002486D2F2|nr:ATPase, T2SS/T4P/T4SS family [Polaromonas sp.]MDI1236330.1 ATPase, T2SS/T4P/T4SS family [Polaromonas sp.]
MEQTTTPTAAPNDAQAAHTIAAILGVVESDVVFSDMLISAGDPVMIRNASGWVEHKMEPYTAEDIEYILSTMDPAFANLLVAGGFSRPFLVGKWRLRVTAYLALRGSKQMLAIRRTPVEPLSLAQTGLPKEISLMVENPKGLILISGATGAGKTTTMAALIDAINTTRNCHIETIEDPIEYVFEAKNSIFSQREVGADTPSFYEGVRGAMRQRPDVIVIGEIRDRDTAENAILASESGHLVIATIHASSAYGAVQKLVSFFPGDEEAKFAALATSLVGVIYQSMVPAVDKVKGVVATELMFNHDQQFSDMLGDAAKVNMALENQTDKISRSMTKSLYDHVAAKRISKGDALRSVAGQGAVRKKLEEMLKQITSS